MRGVGAKMQERNACMTVHGDKEMPRRGPLRREARDAAAAASVRLDIEMNKRYSSGFQTPGICQPSQAVASNQDGVQQGEGNHESSLMPFLGSLCPDQSHLPHGHGPAEQPVYHPPG
ncbi:uncharacterized protein LOC125027542 isoform X2 [Penaeus chinensis]|uniref:uncharacterized protein LOC125027542 isoform X2 n=1 Tax=Penaeus chinensis TaxID=139456 RepID=UPI001FB7AE21|nr:uncharacterized protein LOC125027542 isoform X2 [Penaeus chinensis]